MNRLTQVYDLDLKLLRYFCTIVEEGSFNAAQSTLNISQSMLSESLKSLEQRLGVRLCQRGPKGFKLFAEGEELYHAARKLFQSVDEFRRDVSSISETVGFELSIGIQDGIVEDPRCRIGEAIARFTEYHPNIRFKVETMLGHQLIGHVADGLIQIGIGLPNDRFPQLHFDKLYDEPASIYCGQGHPFFHRPDHEVDREQIKDAAYCHRGNLELFYPGQFQADATHGDIAHGVAAHVALVTSGRNIGFIPDHIARPFVETGQIRAIRTDITQIVNVVGAITGTSAQEFKLARRFVDCLVDVHMEHGQEGHQVKATTGRRHFPGEENAPKAVSLAS